MDDIFYHPILPEMEERMRLIVDRIPWDATTVIKVLEEGDDPESTKYILGVVARQKPQIINEALFKLLTDTSFSLEKRVSEL